MVLPLSERLVYLRKEKGLSQKQAASDLHISQALLSHYERGIRECGLDFLLRCADYYQVTTDYLLGRTMEKSTTPVAKQAKPLAPGKAGQQTTEAITAIFQIAASCHNSALTDSLQEYFDLCTYKMFYLCYLSSKSPSGFLSLPRGRFPFAVDAVLAEAAGRVESVLMGYIWPGSAHTSVEPALIPSLTHDRLTTLYGQYAPSLLTVLQRADALAAMPPKREQQPK